MNFPPCGQRHPVRCRPDLLENFDWSFVLFDKSLILSAAKSNLLWFQFYKVGPFFVSLEDFSRYALAISIVCFHFFVKFLA